MSAVKVMRVARVEESNVVLRILSGASCLCQVLKFADKRDIPSSTERITRQEAAALLGADVFGRQAA